MHRIERITVTTALNITFPQGTPDVSIVLSPALFGSQLGAFLRTQYKLTATDRVRVVSINLYSTSFPDYQVSGIHTEWRSSPLWTLMTLIPFHLNPDGAPAILSQDNVALLGDAYATFFIKNSFQRDQEFPRTITVDHGTNGSGVFNVAIHEVQPTLSGIESGGHMISRVWNPTLDEFEAQLNTGEGLAVYGIVRIQNMDPTTNRIQVTVQMDLELTITNPKSQFSESAGARRRHRRERFSEIQNEAPDFSEVFEASEEGSAESSSGSREDLRARDRSRSRSRRRESSGSRSPMRRTRKSEFLASERRQSPKP